MHHAEAGAKFVHCVTTDKCDVNRDWTPQTLNSHTTFCDVNRRSALRDAHFSKFVYFLAPRGHKNCTTQRRERNSRRLLPPSKTAEESKRAERRAIAGVGEKGRFRRIPPQTRAADGTLGRGTVPPKSLRHAGAAATFPEKARTAQGRQRWSDEARGGVVDVIY